jgi:hypothetical protein
MGRTGEVVAKTVGVVVAVVVGVPLILAIAVIIYLMVALRPPDVAKAAESKAVTELRQAAVADLDTRLDAAVRLVPAAAQQARSVDDECALDTGYMSLKKQVSCDRTVTRYLGFNGDFTKQSAAWDQALQKSGWHGVITPEDRRQGLAQPTEPIRSNRLSRLEYGDQPVGLHITWTSRPTVPDVHRDFDRGITRSDSDGQVFLEQAPVDVAAMADQAFGKYRYLITVEAHTKYYPGVTPAPSTTPPRGHGSCHNGSCPGG